MGSSNVKIDARAVLKGIQGVMTLALGWWPVVLWNNYGAVGFLFSH